MWYDPAWFGDVAQGKARNQRKLYLICVKYSFLKIAIDEKIMVHRYLNSEISKYDRKISYKNGCKKEEIDDDTLQESKKTEKNNMCHNSKMLYHDCTISGRTYPNVTNRLYKVNCRARLNAIMKNKLMQR